MPYKDAEKQKAYFTEYAKAHKARKRELARELRRQRRALLPPPEPPWTKDGRCVSCGLTIYSTPPASCKENRHFEEVKRRRIYGRKSGMLQRQRLRRDAIEKHGSICVLCGFSDIRALSIDHINSDGKLHRSSCSGPYEYYKQLSEMPSSQIQILCANCHAIKTAEEKRNGAIGTKKRKW